MLRTRNNWLDLRMICI